jgi:hypothetical protein
MCSINHKLKIIYISLPKCGCTFISNILTKYYDFETVVLPNENHRDFISFDKSTEIMYNVSKCNPIYGCPWTITEQGILRYDSSCKLYNFVMEMTNDKWSEYKKFTIIRNPYDKFISAWKHVIRKSKENDHNTKLLSLREYIDKSKSELYEFANFAYFHSHITMYDHLLDLNNELHIDYIGTFENLNEELCDILLKVNIDKIKHRKELEENRKDNVGVHVDYIEYYDDSILEKVNEILQKDFDTFTQYKQVYSVEEMKRESNKYLVSEEEFTQKNKALIERLEKDGLII